MFEGLYMHKKIVNLFFRGSMLTIGFIPWYPHSITLNLIIPNH